VTGRATSPDDPTSAEQPIVFVIDDTDILELVARIRRTV
jgi:hypothetical protein